SICVGCIDSSRRRLIIKGVMRSAYSAGHLLFLRDKTLMARKFDTDSLQLFGNEIPLAEQVSINPGTGSAGFAVSDGGVLMYRRETMEGNRRLAWVDRQGHQLERLERPG